MDKNQKKFLEILDMYCIDNGCNFTSNDFRTIWDAMHEYFRSTTDSTACKVGTLARLTKRQTNRAYFSDLPVGTLFIVKEEIDLPAYDLLGYFLGCEPQKLNDGTLHHTGYVERGSWEIIGDVDSDSVGMLNDTSAPLETICNF